MVIGVLEDNPALQDLLLTLFQMEGHEAFGYSSGTDFLNDLFPDAQSPHVPAFDAVTIDLNIPGSMSGQNVIAAIALRGLLQPPLPIIVLTGAGSAEVQKVRTDYPQLHVLEKPFTLAQLRAVLSHMLSSGTGGIPPSCSHFQHAVGEGERR